MAKTKNDLVTAVVEKAGLSKKQAAAAVDAVLDTIKESLASGEKVSLIGFGSFDIKERKAREGRNPQTGEKIKIPAKKVPVFKPGKQLREAVL